MLTCPACKKKCHSMRFSGYHILVEGSVILDEESNVQVSGPLVVKSCVKPGYEITGINVSVTCPNCGHTAHMSKFPKSRICILTGEVADTMIVVPGIIGEVWVSSRIVEDARRFFSTSALDTANEAELARIAKMV